jgi:RHS repeat-associated protein
VTTDSLGNAVAELRYKPWGETRLAGGTTPSKYQFTGQYNESELGLYYYNARWYDGSLGRFMQADSIVPPGAQGLDRYAAMANNPVRYTDPSGHRVCGDGEDIDCNGNLKKLKQKTIQSLPEISQHGSDGCTQANWSIVCKDRTLVSSGEVQTTVVYPTFQTPDTYDGPYADEACAHPLICGFLLFTDLVTGIHYQSNIPAFLSKNYVYANVNYELHSGDYGNYTVVTELEISNSTDAALSLESIHVGEYARLRPRIPIEIKPDQTMIVPTKFIAGSTININLNSQMYSLISLLAILP